MRGEDGNIHILSGTPKYKNLFLLNSRKIVRNTYNFFDRMKSLEVRGGGIFVMDTRPTEHIFSLEILAFYSKYFIWYFLLHELYIQIFH